MFPILDCDGQLKPEVVQSTAQDGFTQANKVLILGETDAWIGNGYNYWLAERGKSTGQGFTMKVDDCARLYLILVFFTLFA